MSHIYYLEYINRFCNPSIMVNIDLWINVSSSSITNLTIRYRTNNHILKHYVRSVVITTQLRQDIDFRMHTFHPFSHSIVVTCTFLRFLSTGAWIQEDDIVNFRISCITYIFSYVSLYNVHSLQAYNSLNGVNYFVN